MLPPKVTVRETTPRQTQAISEILSKDSRWSQNTGTSTACPSANSVSVLTRHAAKLNYKFERWPPSYPMVTFAQGVRERSAGNVPLNGAARYSPSGGVFRRGNPSSIFSKDQIRCYHPGAALLGERRKFSRLVPLHPPRRFIPLRGGFLSRGRQFPFSSGRVRCYNTRAVHADHRVHFCESPLDDTQPSGGFSLSDTALTDRLSVPCTMPDRRFSSSEACPCKVSVQQSLPP
jgi:hypothetical protein